MQLRRRLESVKRIHKAAGTLEDRIKELAQVQSENARQLAELEQSATHIRELLHGTVHPAFNRAA